MYIHIVVELQALRLDSNSTQTQLYVIRNLKYAPLPQVLMYSAARLTVVHGRYITSKAMRN